VCTLVTLRVKGSVPLLSLVPTAPIVPVVAEFRKRRSCTLGNKRRVRGSEQGRVRERGGRGIKDER
jgi:hypothetical protein